MASSKQAFLGLECFFCKSEPYGFKVQRHGHRVHIDWLGKKWLFGLGNQ
jgi:hypothetical protein